MNFEVSKYPCGSDPARDVETALHRAHMPTSHCGLGGGSLRTSSGHFDLFVYGGGTEEVARTTLAASQMNPLASAVQGVVVKSLSKRKSSMPMPSALKVKKSTKKVKRRNKYSSSQDERSR